MKWKAVIVLLAIAFSMVIPPAVSLTMSDSGKAMIGTLDVCHAATPALASNGEMPCVNECPCRPERPGRIEVVRIENSLFTPLLIVHQDERPPIA